LQSVYNYYGILYSLQCIDDALIDAELGEIPQLNDFDRSMCEGPLTYDECWWAVKNMKNEKSPGPDGLPAEFYKALFPLFGYQFVNMLNSVFEQFLELYPPPCVSVT
jgi:hypothetical protein